MYGSLFGFMRIVFLKQEQNKCLRCKDIWSIIFVIKIFDGVENKKRSKLIYW